jgi:hypothetical protein
MPTPDISEEGIFDPAENLRRSTLTFSVEAARVAESVSTEALVLSQQPPALSEISIFHLTHIKNLDDILLFGGLFAKNKMPCKPRSIAHKGIQKKRANKTDIQDDIIYLVTDLGKVREVDFRFSTHNALSHEARFCNKFSDLYLLNWNILFNWDLPESSFIGGNTENCDKERHEIRIRRLAEFLIRKNVSWDLIGEVAVKSESTANKVRSIFARHGINNLVHVKPEWYFEGVTLKQEVMPRQSELAGSHSVKRARAE